MTKWHKTILFLSIFIIVAYLSYDKNISYDKYAKVEISNVVCNFDTINQNLPIQCKFKITNISNNPFYIMDIRTSERTDFLNTKIKKLIHPNDSTYIYTQIIPKVKGAYLNSIILESNAEDKIKLIIKGYVK